MARIAAGFIVIADWRGGALPKEPNRLRPAVVIEDHDLFDPSYPNLIVVPLTSDAGLAIPGLSVIIEPTPENGCAARCYALAPSVTSVSASRVRATEYFIQTDQLAELRRRVAEAIGLG